ncbi:hypothetical protein U0070_018659 [Myodes glareolus]|uniref:Uncharacterized protein n=1 Tax=Myodes glareolus TaxID=447135 RepID=A0AAW0IVD5_MYOGA
MRTGEARTKRKVTVPISKYNWNITVFDYIHVSSFSVEKIPTLQRPESEYRKAQTFSGHEDALGDFGIYEFVAFPDASGIPRMPNRSGPASDGVTGPDFHGTVYEVIQHIPAQQQENPQ